MNCCFLFYLNFQSIIYFLYKKQQHSLDKKVVVYLVKCVQIYNHLFSDMYNRRHLQNGMHDLQRASTWVYSAKLYHPALAAKERFRYMGI